VILQSLSELSNPSTKTLNITNDLPLKLITLHFPKNPPLSLPSPKKERRRKKTTHYGNPYLFY
jgi:hypothetical protein